MSRGKSATVAMSVRSGSSMVEDNSSKSMKHHMEPIRKFQVHFCIEAHNHMMNKALYQILYAFLELL